MSFRGFGVKDQEEEYQYNQSLDQYAYTYTFDVALDDPSVEYGLTYFLEVNCTCIDRSYCFSNYTQDQDNVVSPDEFNAIFTTYFFDNVKNVRSYDVTYGPLFQNSSFNFSYDEFSIKKTDSLFQIDPVYYTENYMMLINEAERVIINDNLN